MGSKKFELRKNDRNFKVGDVIKLCEVTDLLHYPTGRFLIIRITYILQNAENFGLMEGFCIFSFDILEKDTREWVSTMNRLPETSSIVMCKVWDEVLKTTNEYLLKKEDCGWRTVEDNSEIDPNLEILSWKENIVEDTISGIKEEKLKQASAAFQKACNDRLAEKEKIGYTGWDNEHGPMDLIHEMLEDVDSLNFKLDNDCGTRLIDISNRAMMLWHRVCKINEP